VDASWIEFRQRVKSRWSAWSRSLWLSRETWSGTCRELQRQAFDLHRQCDELERRWQQARQEIQALRGELRRRDAARQAALVTLPDDPPVGNHGYGARLISLCVNLARQVGLRAAESALRTVFEWLGCSERVPHWTSIRGWMQRLGVAALNEPAEPADDWVWLADHSNQIGAEKALAVLAVRAAKLPAPGTPLTHQDVRVLAVAPGVSWKRADMGRVYDELAGRFGAPRAVLSDGAVELRDGAETLKTRRADTIVLGDFKHKAANVLSSVVGRDPRFDEFQAAAARTRCAIQQTELAHLVPPGARPKARFMNLAPLLRWSAMTLWLLDQPQACGRAGIAPERIEDKLGWLREYAPDVARWNACQEVVSAGVTFVNEQGLFRGAARRFRQLIHNHLTCDASRQVAARLLAFLRASEAPLRPGERLPLSTEILESTFGLYKQLERQHSKGGFTSLLAAFGALLRPATPEQVKDAFARVSVKEARHWIKHTLPETVTAKRQAAYREHHATIRGATKHPATT
jgi:hypothetical protein